MVPQVEFHDGVELFYSACRQCGATFADEHEVRKSNKAMRDDVIRREIENYRGLE